MNLATVEPIVRSVLYEGYLLYPYRASAVKNRQRFNFGVLSPTLDKSDQEVNLSSEMQTECLIMASDDARLEVCVRFLQLCEREILQSVLVGDAIRYQPVEAIKIDSRTFASWQEADQREVILPITTVQAVAQQPVKYSFHFSSSFSSEPLLNQQGEALAIVQRTQAALNGLIQVFARQMGPDVFQLRVLVINQTPGTADDDRDGTLSRSLVSTHTVLETQGGEFVSLLEPPEAYREFVEQCHNVGTWPVLVGQPGQKQLMLSSPIILYDYPQIAPESPGDLFDGTENDELLTLRILSLTDAEKSEVRELDETARQLLERTESLPPEQLWKLHGAIRGMRPLHQ